MIHLLLRLIIRLHYFFSVSKNKWCALHNLKCTNILSIWLLKRLSDTSEIMKAQTHWQMRQRMQDPTSEGPPAVVPFTELPSETLNLPRGLPFCFVFFLRPYRPAPPEPQRQIQTE